MEATNILEMRGVSKSFYGVQVLKNAQLTVRAGEVHVLLGENGAGKSTLIKVLSGAYRRESGEILLEGAPLAATTPKETLEAGISVIYQEFNLIPHLPIYENIYLGKEYCKNGLIDRAAAIRESRRYMDMIGLSVSPKTLVSKLSVAQKQMVEITKAISNNVKVLVLDEPTAAITDTETERLFQIIRDLKAKGLGIIYISHRMSELFEIGDRCTVMRDGEYVDTVDLKATTEAALTKMMVGRDVSFAKIQNTALRPNDVVLEMRNISWKSLLKNVCLSLHRGEILGVAGLVGAGRTELAKCIIGAYACTGEVLLHGRPLPRSIHGTIGQGVVYLSEDRKDEGLVLIHSIADNIALPNLARFGSPLLSRARITQAAERYVSELHIKCTGVAGETKNLSGGNQQKVVIGKWLCSRANVYIFDEPTRGIDVGARDEIYGIMQRLTQEGASIIMISSDLVEVLKMCDRVAVMREGRLEAVLENDEALTQETILTYALHGGKQNEA